MSNREIRARAWELCRTDFWKILSASVFVSVVTTVCMSVGMLLGSLGVMMAAAAMLILMPVLEAGMVTTDEPGVYIEGSHGIRTENELVCRELESNEYGQFMGFETITYVPIDLDAVIPEQMSPRQRGWLNAYHAFVLEQLTGLMENDDERAWLAHATRAI